MFLSRGQPVVYYGDEQGFAGTGGDKDARQTLFATQVAEYAEPAAGHRRAAGLRRPLRHRRAALRAHRRALAAPRERTRRSTPARRSSATPTTAPASTPSRASTATTRSSTSSRSTTPDRADRVAHHPDRRRLVRAALRRRRRSRRMRRPRHPSPCLLCRPSCTRADTTVTAPAQAARDHRQRPRPGRLTGSAAVPPPSTPPPATSWQETSFAWRVVGGDEWHALGTAEDTVAARLPRRRRPRAGHARRVPRGVDGCRGPPLGRVDLRLGGQSREPRRRRGARGASAEPEPQEPTDVRGRQRAGQLQQRGRLPRRLAARLRRRADDEASTASGRSTLRNLPAGTYEYKIATEKSWTENYGAGGAPNGSNIMLTHDRRPDHVLLRPAHQEHLVDRGRAGHHAAGLAAERARLRRRLGARVPRHDDVRSRPRRRVPVHDRRPADRLVRGEGHARPQLGRELRRRRRPRRSRTSAFSASARQGRDVPLQPRDPRPHREGERPAARGHRRAARALDRRRDDRLAGRSRRARCGCDSGSCTRRQDAALAAAQTATSPVATDRPHAHRRRADRRAEGAVPGARRLRRAARRRARTRCGRGAAEGPAHGRAARRRRRADRFTGVQIPGVLDDLYAEAVEDADARRDVPKKRQADVPAVGADGAERDAAHVGRRRRGRPDASRRDVGRGIRNLVRQGLEGAEGRRVPVGGRRLRADHRRDRDEPGHRPVLASR